MLHLIKSLPKSKEEGRKGEEGGQEERSGGRRASGSPGSIRAEHIVGKRNLEDSSRILDLKSKQGCQDMMQTHLLCLLA